MEESVSWLKTCVIFQAWPYTITKALLDSPHGESCLFPHRHNLGAQLHALQPLKEAALRPHPQAGHSVSHFYSDSPRTFLYLRCRTEVFIRYLCWALHKGNKGKHWRHFPSPWPSMLDFAFLALLQRTSLHLQSTAPSLVSRSIKLPKHFVHSSFNSDMALESSADPPDPQASANPWGTIDQGGASLS